jgi:hypothetical protein
MQLGLSLSIRDDTPCPWCGRGLDDCFCDYCNKCKFPHDGGPPRTGKVLRSVRGPDGMIHTIQWEQGIFAIPTCWDGANHVDPYPRDFEWETVDAPVNCLVCLGA